MAFTFGQLPDLKGSFIITDERGNYFYGFLNERLASDNSKYIFKSYTAVGVNYNGTNYSIDRYTKQWTQSGLRESRLTIGFQDWFEKATQAMKDFLPDYFPDRF